MTTPSPLRDLDPATVHDDLRAGRILLVDVREPQEFAVERIHGAMLFPLSTFDPAMLPQDPGKPIVFQCGSGKRSAMAAAKCREAGLAVNAHLAGGMMAWKAAGMPYVALDSATGQVIDRR